MSELLLLFLLVLVLLVSYGAILVLSSPPKDPEVCRCFDAFVVYILCLALCSFWVTCIFALLKVVPKRTFHLHDVIMNDVHNIHSIYKQSFASSRIKLHLACQAFELHLRKKMIAK